MTNNEEITVECFLERVENFMDEYKKLRDEKNECYEAYESKVLNLIYELKKDMREVK